MQTNFSLAQLADPALATSEKILRTCVHCGFCTATCPTYLMLGDELDSPRGRIYLIKDMLENSRPATPDVVQHIDRCLSCLSCMTTCPSGVHYMHLIDHARAYIAKTHRRPPLDRMLRTVLAAILPYPGRFRVALAGAFLAKALLRPLGLLPRPATTPPTPPLAPGKPSLFAIIGAMLSLAPSRFPARPDREPASAPAQGARKGRVLVMQGCAQTVLRPSINTAAASVLTRHGIEVVVAKDEGCCGALVHHMGEDTASHAQAKRNIDAWMREIDGEGLDAILITASGCGTTVKDYGFMFASDPAYAEKAARVSALTRDISEYLATLEGLEAVRTLDAPVAYHAACSLQHGQQIKDAPKDLLRRLGVTVKEPLESHICCGSAGVYNILQPEIAGALRDRKAGFLARTKAPLVVAGNIGCLVQLAKGFEAHDSAPSVVHLAELVDWLTGGEAADVETLCHN